jgi:hypothetical protein
MAVLGPRERIDISSIAVDSRHRVSGAAEAVNAVVRRGANDTSVSLKIIECARDLEALLLLLVDERNYRVSLVSEFPLWSSTVRSMDPCHD